MARRSSHVASALELLQLLPAHQSIKDAQNHQIQLPMLGAMAQYLGLETESVAFGKVLLWTSVFFGDGFDAIKRSSLEERDQSTALRIYGTITSPFRYPFAASTPGDFLQKHLNENTRSLLSLINSWIQKEHPIYIPESEEIDELLANFDKFIRDFEDIDIPIYLKNDFRDHLNLYKIVAKKLPFIAHQFLAHEQGKLTGWIFAGLPDDARRILVRASVAVSALVAAFVMPAEVYDATETYYDWAKNVLAEAKRVEAVAAPLALPSPSISPSD